MIVWIFILLLGVIQFVQALLFLRYMRLTETRFDGVGKVIENEKYLRGEAVARLFQALHHRGVLSAQVIAELRIVEPCSPPFKFNGYSGGLSACGYDISLKNELNIPPGCFKLGASIERFNLPLNVVGIVHDKSTWARQGLALQNTVLEPGWRGYLTLEISNHGRRSIRIPGMTPIAQVVFSYLNEATDLPYAGKYQDQAQGATEARFDEANFSPAEAKVILNKAKIPKSIVFDQEHCTAASEVPEKSNPALVPGGYTDFKKES